MAQTKEQKKETLQDLKEKIDRHKTMVLIDFKGLKVKEIFDLRKKLKKANCLLQVAKKTLIDLAFKEKGIPIDLKKMEGQIAIVFGFQDEIMPAKLAYLASKENGKLKILGGYFENTFKESEEMITLAQLPGREELLARLTGSVAAPLRRFVNVLQANIKGLIYILNAIKQ